MAVLRERGLSTWRVPSPPTTTTATTTTTTATVVTYTHPSELEKLRIGTPYLSGGAYSVRVSWDPPNQTGSSSVKNYEIRSGSDTWTATGNQSSTTVSLSGSTTRSFEVRAINYDGRAGDWSTKAWVYASAFPTAPTTTTPPEPHYKLWVWEDRNVRWNPCDGQINIGFNHNGRLSNELVMEWAAVFEEQADTLSSITGLDLVYVGFTGKSLQPNRSHPGSRQPHDILFYFGPPGSGLLDQPGDEAYWGNTFAYVSGSWEMEQDFFNALYLFEVHINSDLASDSSIEMDKRYIMHYLGRALGLDRTDEDIDTEIMSWNGWGSGSSPGDPNWGLGDRMVLALVGASNGCFE